MRRSGAEQLGGVGVGAGLDQLHEDVGGELAGGARVVFDRLGLRCGGLVGEAGTAALGGGRAVVGLDGLGVADVVQVPDETAAGGRGEVAQVAGGVGRGLAVGDAGLVDLVAQLLASFNRRSGSTVAASSQSWAAAAASRRRRHRGRARRGRC